MLQIGAWTLKDVGIYKDLTNYFIEVHCGKYILVASFILTIFFYYYIFVADLPTLCKCKY